MKQLARGVEKWENTKCYKKIRQIYASGRSIISL